MALQSKSISANGSKGHTAFRLEVYEDSTNLNDNTSSLSFNFIIYPIYGKFDWYGHSTKISYSVNIGGNVYSGYIPDYDGSSTISLRNVGGIIIDHDNEGNKTIPFSFSVIDNTGKTYTCGNAGASGTMGLTKIPRTSSFIVTGDTLGSEMKVDITRANDNFTHLVAFTYGSSEYELIDDNVQTSITFTPSISFASYTPNAPKGIGYVKVVTYNGDTYIGERVVTFTCNIPESIIPTIQNVKLEEQSNLPSNFDVYIKNKSTIKVSVDASGIYGSTIKNYYIKINGVTYSGNEITTDLIKNAGVNNYEVTIVDSRGRTSNIYTGEFNVFDYENPTISKLTADRQDIETDVRIDISAFIYDINNENSKSFTLKYKKKIDSVYNIAFTIDNTYSISNESFLLSNIDDNYTYDFLLEATDSFTTITYPVTISTAYTVMDFKANGNGIAFGKTSEKDNTFECALDIECNNLTVNGKLIAEGQGGGLDNIYPVGSIYLSVNDTDPSTLFGGTWEQIAQGRTLIGVGTGTDINNVSQSFEVNNTGGEYKHTQTINEMPIHTHSQNAHSHVQFTIGNDATANPWVLSHNSGAWGVETRQQYAYRAGTGTNLTTGGTTATNNNTGGGQSFNVMQPFLAVYMFKRIA